MSDGGGGGKTGGATSTAGPATLTLTDGALTSGVCPVGLDDEDELFEDFLVDDEVDEVLPDDEEALFELDVTPGFEVTFEVVEGSDEEMLAFESISEKTSDGGIGRGTEFSVLTVGFSVFASSFC